VKLVVGLGGAVAAAAAVWIAVAAIAPEPEPTPSGPTPRELAALVAPDAPGTPAVVDEGLAGAFSDLALEWEARKISDARRAEELLGMTPGEISFDDERTMRSLQRSPIEEIVWTETE
jgi:hypothetical protein